jgi:hypothetical protein
MATNIGYATQDIKLQRDFNLQQQAPKTLYEH